MPGLAEFQATQYTCTPVGRAAGRSRAYPLRRGLNEPLLCGRSAGAADRVLESGHVCLRAWLRTTAEQRLSTHLGYSLATSDFRKADARPTWMAAIDRARSSPWCFRGSVVMYVATGRISRDRVRRNIANFGGERLRVRPVSRLTRPPRRP